ncbi:hypothetical protein ESCOMM109M1_13635 [Escherichia coli]|nr:hypothetical protein BvCmsKKP036_01135 [Escherichia coli]VUX23750.1 Uncharacterised protein [Escherichia fergusonii]
MPDATLARFIMPTGALRRPYKAYTPHPVIQPPKA